MDEQWEDSEAGRSTAKWCAAVLIATSAILLIETFARSKGPASFWFGAAVSLVTFVAGVWQLWRGRFLLGGTRRKKPP